VYESGYGLSYTRVYVRILPIIEQIDRIIHDPHVECTLNVE
jgi:hypothetical protein